MIEEQHALHMGLFPVDMKCQTVTQQQSRNMLVNGNERMLTTSTTAATTTTSSATTTKTTLVADSDAKNEGAIKQKMNDTTTTTTTTETLSTDILATTTTMSSIDSQNGKVGSTLLMLTNVSGYVNNHNTNQNNNNNNNNNNENCDNNNNNNNSKNFNNNNNNLTESSSGPGPPPLNQLTLTNVRNACASTVGRCFSDNNNNNNNNNNHDFYNNNMISHCDEQQQQQQMMMHLQQQQQRLITQRHQHQQHQHMNMNNNRITALLIGKNSHVTHCAYCCQPINDRYIMRVMDTYFHETCLKCANCSQHLVHSCFARDGKLYCRIDYEQLFLRNRCLGCGHNIAADELVMRTLENVFHLKCFACVVCGTLLKKGEQYVVKQGQLFCRFDYEKEVEMLQGYDFYADDLFPPKMDGRRGPKRPRTILNTQQRRAFKASFELSPKPCRKIRENLAKETGLSLRIVQVWFQNQRAKVKKIQKKAKTEPIKGTSDSQDSQESDGSLTKVKDETHSDNESLLESPYSTCGNFFNCTETPEKLPCIKKEQEASEFNCVETNKENCNKTNEPILNSILGLSYATFQQLMAPFSQSNMVNPIDRLYSMQNSYFRPDDLNLEDFEKAANNV